MAEEFIDLDPLDPEDVQSQDAVHIRQRDEAIERAQQYLRDRRDAYRRYFSGTGGPGDRRLVMEDLRRFCRGGETAWDEDPRRHALLTGRQEVYQRIIDHLELEFDDMWMRYNK
jgi:hypothetical protein